METLFLTIMAVAVAFHSAPAAEEEPIAALMLEGQSADGRLDEHFAFYPRAPIEDLWGEGLAVALYTESENWPGVLTASFGCDVNQDGILASEETALVLLFSSEVFHLTPSQRALWPHLDSADAGPDYTLWSHPRARRNNFPLYTSAAYWYFFQWQTQPFAGYYLGKAYFQPSILIPPETGNGAIQWDETLQRNIRALAKLRSYVFFARGGAENTEPVCEKSKPTYSEGSVFLRVLRASA